MINYFLFLGFLRFFISLAAFCTRYKHIISILLRLEMMALRVLIRIAVVILTKGSEDFILIPFLTIIVCEGRLGLSLLVIITRFFGNDFIKTTNLLKF